MKKTFYIFRHGQSSYNLAGRTQGQTNDSVLTELGQQQAVQVGQRLQDKHIELILCSPLVRARQTAELANRSLNVPIIYDDRFIEVNVGEIEGLHYTEIMEKYGEKYQQWRSSDQQFENLRFNGGESKKEVRQRVFAGLQEYAEQSPYSVIAVSSHGIMLTQLFIALGKKAVDVPNGSILQLEYQDNSWKIIGLI